MCEDKVRRIREGKPRTNGTKTSKLGERKGEKESERKKRVKESEREIDR